MPPIFAHELMSRHPENAAKHCTSATLLRRHEAARSEQVNDAVNKILDALRSNGYEPALRIEDVEIYGPE
jgi:hypothetical protein